MSGKKDPVSGLKIQESEWWSSEDDEDEKDFIDEVSEIKSVLPKEIQDLVIRYAFSTMCEHCENPFFWKPYWYSDRMGSTYLSDLDSCSSCREKWIKGECNDTDVYICNVCLSSIDDCFRHLHPKECDENILSLKQKIQKAHKKCMKCGLIRCICDPSDYYPY